MCSATPTIKTKLNKNTGKEYKSISFLTISLPLFNSYHNMFYKKRVKHVPQNIGEFLTARALAILILDDGDNRGETRLSTHSFSPDDLGLLREAL
jgi:LAGLIDADG DNA endonuclease family